MLEGMSANATPDDATLRATRAALSAQHRRLMAQHADIHARPVNLAEHAAHKRDLRHHLEDIHRFQAALENRKQTTSR